MNSMSKSPDLTMRLQKYLAHRGIASRRQIEAWIEEGSVRVNGQLAILGMKVDPEKDHVVVNGRRIKPGARLKEPITFIMYKPKGYLCTNKDPFHSDTVFQLLPPKYRKEKLICAGRLDKDSEGMVVLTNDGELAQRIMHPSHGVVKRYDVTLETLFDPNDLAALRAGVIDEGEMLRPDKVVPARPGPTRSFEVHLSEGKKREIRRLFQAFGHNVRKLKRFQMGKLSLKGMAIGSCLRLKDSADIERLFA